VGIDFCFLVDCVVGTTQKAPEDNKPMKKRVTPNIAEIKLALDMDGQWI
jgi:hypothetical protein